MQYMVTHRHPPEECETQDSDIEELPAHLKGKDFYCSCPYGEHGFVMFIEGETAEEVIRGLPAAWRKGTRAVGVEVFKL